MSKINDFKEKNQSLISDLSTINAYIKQLDISVELVNELFKLGARKKDFRVLLSNFGEIKNNDFTRFYDNPLALLCVLVGSQQGGLLKDEILVWALNLQIKIKLADISSDELISLLDVDVDVDAIGTEWFLEALSTPRGDVNNIKISFLLWLADRRLATKQSESELNELTRLDIGMDVDADD
ncbi:hypothetical protein [bacterium endosymbiont of Bathymodiolus sp. 5 South]|uniref:hypothetical protein n=1 Tax=bacterium endosymbiont of Bathymodiolus sp. 5 South TaxID=1181670 RepID=UPI0010B71FB8|nr:hypothetical protein [bacterium endosymbiont of Bathymodiolus sp. 5 South]SSC08515.1 hypothetical protein BTURTLESOX_425 [bacterium endosymbiont of Bathymodiolus sp. 5 South]